MASATIAVAPKALQVARATERATRSMTEAKRHDKVVDAVRDAGFDLPVAIRAAYEALAE